MATAKPAPPAKDSIFYGLSIKEYEVGFDSLKRGSNLGSLLRAHGKTDADVERVRLASAGVFAMSNLRTDRRMVFFHRRADAKLARLVYEASAEGYLQIDWTAGVDTPALQYVARQVSTRQRTVGGIIAGSLYASLEGMGTDPGLATSMARIYDWTLDFFKIKEGDWFKVVIEERVVEGKATGVPAVVGLQFNFHGKDYYAFRYRHNGKWEYRDEKGRPMKKAYLRTPLAFFRISSKFSKRRFHPVQQVFKPHLGVDYAAPTGTPIRAVADGVVEEAAQRGGNGIFVKLRHNAGMATGYLHMSRHAKGMRKGISVAQGQVIGYVGSTGLATGPHLCFRFWKGGTQVDPLKVIPPPPEPLPPAAMRQFAPFRDSVMVLLKGLRIEGVEDAVPTGQTTVAPSGA